MMPGRVRLIAVLGVLVSLVFPSKASAASIKFCFRTNGTFTDNNYALPDGTKEDFWQADSPREMRGAKMVIQIGNTTYFNGNLGDGVGTGDPGAGCTNVMNVPNANSTYSFYQYSSGGKIDAANGQHTLNGKHKNLSGTSNDVNIITVWSHTGGEGTFSVELLGGTNQDRTWRALAASAWALVRTGRWTSAGTLNVTYDEGAEGVFVGKWNSNGIFLSPSATGRKFVIAHEVGHFIANRHAYATGGNCSLADSQCPSGGGAVHSFTSKEIQSCAFTEGLANALSAVTWNSREQSDCVYRSGGFSTTFDCEGSQTHPLRYMEVECNNTSHTNRGVELDWLRQFWDVLTDGSGVTLLQFLNWISNAHHSTLGWYHPYGQLDSSANAIGGTLNSNWDAMKAQNGIDW
jgi:hypothetical protein